MNNEEMSGLFEKLNGVIDTDKISPDMVNSLLGMLGNNSNNASTSNSSDTYSKSSTSDTFSSFSDSSANANTIDMETLLKMKSIIEQMNSTKDDPRSNLLLSLKPYLKESRKGKLDQYVQFMNMSKYMNFLPFMGGGNKKDG